MGFFDFLSTKKPSDESHDGLKVKEIMTSNPIVVPGTETIARIEEIFSKNSFWSIYVGDPGNYIGIITRDDIKFRGRNKSKSSPAYSIMSKGVFSIDENADVEEAKTLIYNKKINSLAVTKNGKHCGIITRYDIKNKQSKSYNYSPEETSWNDPSNTPSSPSHRDVPHDTNQLIRTLISELENNSNSDVRNSAATQLGSFHEPSVVNALIKCVKNDPKVRYRALTALKNIADPLGIPVFIERLKDRSLRIRLVSVNALGELGDLNVVRDLESHVKSKDYQNSLKNGGNPEIIQAAREAIQKIRVKEKKTHERSFEFDQLDYQVVVNGDTFSKPVQSQDPLEDVKNRLKDASDLNKQGYKLAKMKKFEEAIVFFEKALLIDKNFIDALNNHGWASSQLGRYEEAISYYENAKKIDPNNIRAWRAIGWNLARIHRYDEALTYINTAISLDSHSGRSWNHKGEVLSFKGEFEDALICFEKALNLDPKNVKAKENIIRVKKMLTPSVPVAVVREYEFYAGHIRLKISVKNLTPLTIHDVKLYPDLDHAILYLERHEPEEYLLENDRLDLGSINPNNNRTVNLYLEPIICAKEGTDVYCHVRFKDAKGKPGSLDMEPLTIKVVCPIFETKGPVNIGMLKQLIESLPSRETKIFSISKDLDSLTQLKLFQSVIQLHDIRLVSTLRRLNNFESWYYGKTKVTQNDVVIKLGILKDRDMVEITVHSYDPKDLTGLLAEISRHVTEELSLRGNVKKIFNVKIEGSVIQRSNLMSFCDSEGKCSGDVTIEDSVVMHSNIG
jgi:tetratricopeptide (TPR) repeat protein/CBS domain-containing protein